MTHYKNEAKINQFAQFSKFDHTLAAILNDRSIFYWIEKHNKLQINGHCYCNDAKAWTLIMI